LRAYAQPRLVLLVFTIALVPFFLSHFILCLYSAHIECFIGGCGLLHKSELAVRLATMGQLFLGNEIRVLLLLLFFDEFLG